jgi:3-deoxy-D-manno-octulosonic acid (KDO) 8-phosphate synthase
MAFDTAGQLKDICRELGIPFIYKSSYDKANRSSGKSYRGLGMEKGLEILAEVREQIGVPVLTDVTSEAENRGRGRGRRCAADAGLPLPPDRLHPGRAPPPASR